LVSFDPGIVGSDRFTFSTAGKNIPPNSSQTIRVSFRPDRWMGQDTATLRLPTVSRATMSTVVISDAGSAATLSFEAGLHYREAMQLALGELIAGMGTTRTLEDEMAVYASGNGPADLLHAFTGSKAALAALRLPPFPADSSCVIPALEAAIDHLRGKKSDRRIVLFTALGDPDAATCGDTSLAAVLDRATAAQIPVHVVSFGSRPATALEQLALATGGTFVEAGTFIRVREQLEIVEAFLTATHAASVRC
jgi:hypothetical protein